MSHRYGNRRLKESIEKLEFEEILNNSKPVEYNGVNMLKHCYESDENDIGDVKYYRLKPIEDIFKGLQPVIFALFWWK